jgi:hypothetical protein
MTPIRNPLRSPLSSPLSRRRGGGAPDYSIDGVDPDYVLDFLNNYYRVAGASASLSAAVNFARSSVGAFVSALDSMQTVAADAPRVGHHIWDGFELRNAGVLFEVDGSQNIVAQSDDLNASGWSLTSCTFDTASGVLTSSAGGFARYTIPGVLVNNADYTETIEIIPGTVTWVRMFSRNKASADSFAYVNLSTGAIGTTSGSATWNAAVENGVCRITEHFNAGSGATAPFIQIQFAFNDNNLGATAGTSFRVRRLQIEPDTISSSFIPASGSAVTRAGEGLTTTALTFDEAGVWGAIKGTETYFDAGTAGQVLLFDWRVDANNRITVSIDTDGAETGEITLTSVVGGVSTSVAVDLLTPGQYKPFEIGWRVDPDEINLAVNGVANTAAAVAGIPNLSGALATFSGNGTRATFKAGTGVITDDVLEHFAGKPPEVHAILLIGQSNMQGRATYDSAGGHPAFVDQWTQAGAVADATLPLDYVDAVAGSMGPDITFSARYRLAYPNARLLFIPCAKGSTGFNDNNWNEGDAEYESAVSRTLAALAAEPTAELKGVLWLQGENDAADSVFQSAYAAALDAMIASLRADLNAPALPFVAGQIGTFLSGGVFFTATGINAAIADLPNRVPNTAYVSSAGITTSVDGVHFTNPAQVRTLGSRFFEALNTLL